MRAISKVVFVIIGTMIGAGFASGQEIWLFFNRYGNWGIAGIIVSSCLSGFLIYKVFLVLQKGNLNTYPELLKKISNKKISKASAIKKVALLEKIDSNNIICFGDGLNDIDMLEYCGVSVAMGNALEEVKNVCKYITDTNDNDGIVRFLEKYLDNKDKVVHE